MDLEIDAKSPRRRLSQVGCQGVVPSRMAESEGFEPPLGCPKPDFENVGNSQTTTVRLNPKQIQLVGMDKVV